MTGFNFEFGKSRHLSNVLVFIVTIQSQVADKEPWPGRVKVPSKQTKGINILCGVLSRNLKPGEKSRL